MNSAASDAKVGGDHTLLRARLALDRLISCGRRPRHEQRDSKGGDHKGQSKKREFTAMTHIPPS